MNVADVALAPPCPRVLDAAVDGTAQHRHARLGFTEVGRWWQVGRP